MGATAVVLATPSLATAATVSVSSPHLLYTADPGETNAVSITIPGGDYVIEDAGAPVTAGAGCTQETIHRATCPATYVDWLPEVRLGDGNDTAHLFGLPPADELQTAYGWYSVLGGAGNDTVVGSGLAENVVSGEGGDDVLLGGPRSDALDGGGGNDKIRGGLGTDQLNGGAGSDRVVAEAAFDHSDTMSAGSDRTEGIDTLDYSARPVGVTTFVLDSPSYQGHVQRGAEYDTLTGGFDNVIGGGGTDSIEGNELPNRLEGKGGRDLVDGRAGADLLLGGNGDDVLAGGSGPDVLEGQAGIDIADYMGRAAGVSVKINNLPDDGTTEDGPAGARDNIRTSIENIRGTANADFLEGSAFRNRLDGGFGPDVLSGLGGIDTVSYADRLSAVDVRIDNVASDGNSDDGPVGARDDVRANVENLVGENGNDLLQGNSAPNVLDGGRGGDDLRGLGGADTAYYGDRAAGVLIRINGVADDGNAADVHADNVELDVENVDGGAGPDAIFGSDGPNRIVGGLGSDQLRGAGGDDTILGQDGVADDILCGLGIDTLFADGGLDSYPASGSEACENVST